MSTLSDDAAIGGYEPTYVEVDGIDTRYYHFGEGPPAVLIHGGAWGGTASANSWAGAFDALSNEFEVYAFDRIGCGLTGPPENIDDLVLEDVVNHAVGFLDAVDIERCHLMGSSFGAGIATLAALREPDRFATLVLTNSGTISPPVGDPNHRRALLNRGMPESDGSLESERARVRFQFETFAHSTDFITDEFVDTVARMTHAEGSQRMLDAMESEWGERFQGSLQVSIQDAHANIAAGQLQIPTLLIWGGNDLTTPIEAGKRLYDMIGQHEEHVQFHVYNNCGHLPYSEYPQAFADATIGFVRRHEE